MQRADATVPIHADPDAALVAQRQVEIRALVGVLWRRKWLLVFCICAAAGLARMVLQHVPDRYAATAEVMLNNRQTNIVEFQNVVSDLGGHDVAANEQRVLTSVTLLQRVVERLRLDLDPEFNPSLRTPGMLTRWRIQTAAWLPDGPLAHILRPAPPLDPVLARDREHREIIGTFREALSVTGIPRTRSIGITVVSTDPDKAALIANTLADLYIFDQLESKFEATRRASAWLNERITDLKRKVETSEAAVETFKASMSVGEGQGEGLTMQQIAELNTELIAARAATAEATARFGQVNRRLKSGGISAAADVVSSPLILTLRTQLADLLRREAELGTRYGNKHPRMINVRAETKDVRAAISTEVRKIIEGLRNDMAVARAREQALEQSLGELEDRSVVISRSSVQLRQLEREAEADRQIYQNFLNRFRETTEQENLQDPDARVLSEATPPLVPAAPNVKKFYVIAIVLGLVGGLGLILILERLNNTYRTSQEVTDRTGLPVLAALPQFGRRRQRRQVLDYMREKPNSALAEAARSLRTTLLLSNIDAPPKVVMVTSSVPEEGKSTTSLLLAQMSLHVNRSAIVVDCDLRRPTLQATFRIEDDEGLMPVLEGSMDLDKAIVVDPATGLHLLPVARPVPQSADILSSRRFADLIERLRGRYDLVLLDTPPVLPVSDALAVGKLVDTTLYAVRWNHTQREIPVQGLSRLREVGVPVTGCVVTMVDRLQEARYANATGYYASSNAYYAG